MDMFSIYLDVLRVCLIDNQDSGLLINKIGSFFSELCFPRKKANFPMSNLRVLRK